MKVNKEKEAILSLERLKELLDYNPETGVFVWLKNTSKHGSIKIGTLAGCVDKSTGYIRIRLNGYSYLAHRLAWFYMRGYFPFGYISFLDHVDGIKTNNRFDNLREASSSENSRNRGKLSNNTSGFVGVSETESGKFRARIQNPVTKKEEHLGTYATQEEASAVRDTSARLYYGEFYRKDDESVN